MNKSIVTFLIVLTSVFSVVAQPGNNRPTKEDLFSRKWEFVSQRASLTATEAVKIQPLFMEYEEQIWQLFAGNRKIFRSQRTMRQQATVDFEAINDAIIETEITKATLQKNYYQRLKKVTDAETINKIFHAEKAYQKDLIQKIPGRQRQGNGAGFDR